MTTARRRARAGTVTATEIEVGGRKVAPPAEVLDPGHALWADGERYRGWMTERGWIVPPADRLPGSSASPVNRRNAAAAAWGRSVRVVALGALARRGLYGRTADDQLV